jgi:hypothetical protein
MLATTLKNEIESAIEPYDRSPLYRLVQTAFEHPPYNRHRPVLIPGFRVHLEL